MESFEEGGCLGEGQPVRQLPLPARPAHQLQGVGAGVRRRGEGGPLEAHQPRPLPNLEGCQQEAPQAAPQALRPCQGTKMTGYEGLIATEQRTRGRRETTRQGERKVRLREDEDGERTEGYGYAGAVDLVSRLIGEEGPPLLVHPDVAVAPEATLELEPEGVGLPARVAGHQEPRLPTSPAPKAFRTSATRRK